MSKQISCSEMIQMFQEYFCEGKYIYIMCDHEYGKSIVGTEQLEVNYDDGNITFSDINDTNLSIDKSYIRWISLSGDFVSEIINIDLGETKISFVTNK